MTRRTLRRSRHPTPEPEFVESMLSYLTGGTVQLLRWLWESCDELQHEYRPILHDETVDLERELTHEVFLFLQERVPREAPFRVTHEPPEEESRSPNPKARPPQPDIGFVTRANRRFLWPVEAKVLATSTGTGEYLSDLRANMLTGRYGPYSPSGAMIGYLLTGHPEHVFARLERQGPMILHRVGGLEDRAHRASCHLRQAEEDYPFDGQIVSEFECHHLIISMGGEEQVGLEAEGGTGVPIDITGC